MSASESNVAAKPRTRVAIILDKSWSMESTLEQALSGYNEQVRLIKKMAETQDIRVSLVTFCGEVFEHLWDRPADELQEAKVEDYKLGDWTAMRDAVGYVVKKLKDTADADDQNTAYLVIVISDGETNRDTQFAGKEGILALKELIGSVQATKRWTITYMGCSEDYLKEVAEQTGVPVANMAAWSNKTVGSTVKGLRAATARTAMYFGSRALGDMSVDNYYSDDKLKCANFIDDEPEPVASANEPVIGSATASPAIAIQAEPVDMAQLINAVQTQKPLSVPVAQTDPKWKPGVFGGGTRVLWQKEV